jgi:hypothetical protein
VEEDVLPLICRVFFSCCNLQDAPQRRERRTAQKQAALLAIGEIGYEGGLGEVASAAVID